MSSLAELPELIGFFSYSREDDEDSHGALSALRDRIQRELRGQLGRSMKTFRLWQDKEAIAPGTLWETEIKTAVEQSAFFIPIITPTVVRSPYCRFELDSFLTREAALGRSDLVFPILYIKVPALEDSTLREHDPVLSVIAKRQYLDWREFRHRDVNSTDIKEAVERFCAHICDALRRSWLSPQERKEQEAAAVKRQAKAEQRRRQAEAEMHREDEARRKAAEEEQRQHDAELDERRKAEAEAEAEAEANRRRQAEDEKRRAEAERQRAENERIRREAREKRQAERRSGSEPLRLPSWTPRQLTLAAGAVVGLVLIGVVGFRLAAPPTSVAVKETSPSPAASIPVAPVAAPAPINPSSAPAPAAPTQPTGTLSAAQERSLKRGDIFQECANCPQMVVVPPGNFVMGLPTDQTYFTYPHGEDKLRPQHNVTIAKPFAVSKFELTFAEWDACVADGGCDGYKPNDHGWGRGQRPVIAVNWFDATAYVAWLSKKTGKPYRLLSEAEYEYAARAGTTTAYPWGNEIGKNNANCNGCGSQWDVRQTAPVGSFAPNQFGLYDMVGNVQERTEDCWHNDYNGAPTDGSAWTSGDCSVRVIRGGSWGSAPYDLRSAARYANGKREDDDGGIRVGRTLLMP
jgi:formylglycine-generating enzyme required for sulfatase activity